MSTQPNVRPLEALLGGPIVDKNGVPTPFFARLLRDLATRNDKVLTNSGQIQASSPVTGRAEGIGTTVKNLTPAGQLNALSNALDDAAYAKTRAAQLSSGIIPVAYGKSLLPNPGFESNLNGTPLNVNITAVGQTVGDSWNTLENDNAYFVFQLSTAQTRSGKNSGFIALADNLAIPNLGTGLGTISSSALLPVQIGDIMRVFGFSKRTGTALPGGVSILAVLGVNIFRNDGVFLGNILTQSTPGGAFTQTQAALQIPATIGGGVPAYAQFVIALSLSNASGAVFNTGVGNGYAGTFFDDLRVVLQNTAFELTPINTAGTPTSITGLCTQHGAGLTQIDVGSSVWQYGDGTVSYSSGSVDPGSLGTWYIYADDPTYSGGPVIYIATATPSVCNAANGRLFFGKITTAAGTATSSGGGSGGGGPFSKAALQ